MHTHLDNEIEGTYHNTSWASIIATFILLFGLIIVAIILFGEVTGKTDEFIIEAAAKIVE